MTPFLSVNAEPVPNALLAKVGFMCPWTLLSERISSYICEVIALYKIIGSADVCEQLAQIIMFL